MNITKLNFKLHNFQRITWASEKLKLEWSQTILKLPEVIEDLFISSEVLELIPIQIKFIHVNKLYEYKRWIFSKDLFAEHLVKINPLYSYIFSKGNTGDGIPVIIGKRKDVIKFIQNISNLSYTKHSTRLPEMVISFWQQFMSFELSDRIWGYLQDEDNNIQKFINYENNLLNPCWDILGISALPYNPNSMNCNESIGVANKIKEIAEILMPIDFYRAFNEILSWPTEWSALHGIAEIKTPLFKLIYNTDATTSIHRLQFHSGSYPENGLKGLLFPYKKPNKLYFSESSKFKSGQEHLGKSLDMKSNKNTN